MQRAETGPWPQALDTCISGLFTHIKQLLASVLSQQQLNWALGSDGVNHVLGLRGKVLVAGALQRWLL